ncbi:hypothetical protein VOLCADRAFT_91941 [Volvox carteri f. nagariensis]|uniref:Phospholipid/glycerol acyltransferase domain-containing protein n=1 Tax=Volvox carteri f. nagariensis TaxID=3068 RepID=D8TYD0_VOLCA|nr:uncharacterized protein VOLCADRAFT_91941 [Volvox carteri f. nagariensis]EFJ47621.1 hypothetical protein VOLCADRAFT_91941 [Volvox carteri f. nagariensis]|eukprot:XP_002951445.1 hypothetical protein VOLCADRAFT_91941 [Volvox carteri f. nagariensis]
MAHQPNGWLGQLPPDIKAKAFIRRDLYGSYCNNVIPLASQLRLAVLSITLLPIKLLACLLCVLSFYLVVVFGNTLFREPFKTKYMAFWGKFWTRALLYCLGFWSISWVYVNPDGSSSLKPPSGLKERRFGGYVSNHCSWIDIVLYMSRLFPSFVAKKEVSTLPLIGPISKAMQCMFVDREARLAALGDKGEGGGQGTSQLVRDRMLRKFKDTSTELPMLLFPEGTTTNNLYVMPFKRGAFIAGVPVQPLVLKYDTSGRFSPTWDSMPGHFHIFLVLTELSFRVTCYVLPLYEPSEAEKADPALYADNVRQMMVKYSKIPACEDTYADKLAFFKYIMDRMRQDGLHGSRAPETCGAADVAGEAPSKVEVEARAAADGMRQRR